MYTKKWIVNKTDGEIVRKIMNELNVPALVAKILAARGVVGKEDGEKYLRCDEKVLYDPFLLKDMDKAVERIKRAIDNKEKVCIYGDYDVDGITSTIILYKFLSEKGVECTYFIPERIQDGYGLSAGAIERLAGEFSLIITVDTGITAIEEAKLAKNLGLDMVITDHHRYGDEIPDAVAVVNPHRPDCEYPFKNLAGVGVVFKLICALSGENGTEDVLKKFGDIVAIGTIADVMPIVDENRYISAYGLQLLKNTCNVGLKALMEEAGVYKDGIAAKKLNSTVVGYTIAPRINAAGRITSAHRAAELLLSEEKEEAKKIAAELCEINKRRQALEMEMFSEALLQIEEKCKEDRVLVLSSDGWHQGVIGVVASKITEKYSLPSILISFDGDLGKGSGRSIKGFSIMDALKNSESHLVKFGGHELAAGLTINRDNLEDFRRSINEYAKKNMNDEITVPVVNIDCEVALSELSLESVKELQLLEPYGLQNPQPVFTVKNVEIVDIAPISEGKHTKFKVKEKGAQSFFYSVFFGMAYDNFSFTSGDMCDIVFSAEINEHFRSPSVQLFIKQVRPMESDNAHMEETEKYISSPIEDNCPHPKEYIPTIDDFRSLFKFVRSEFAQGEPRRISLTYLRQHVRRSDGSLIPLPALKVILMVFEEFNLARIRFFGEGCVAEITTIPAGGKKIDLEKSAVLSRVKGNQ
ncbi:MAG: single-stranded-DNA-specific exonuclease RecJ [Ruminococcaceae bacterium]|nr:single-stranded-DNA-specific exonuclease RecJ [Oscillospiraceae bacterium]